VKEETKVETTDQPTPSFELAQERSEVKLF